MFITVYKNIEQINLAEILSKMEKEKDETLCQLSWQRTSH